MVVKGLPGRRLAVAAVLAAVACCMLAAPAGAKAWKWSRPSAIHGMRNAVNGLSCPSTRLCVAVSGVDVFWSTTPARGSSWKRAKLPPAPEDLGGQSYVVTDVSCPTTSFCIAVDQAGNSYTSTHPTGGARAWALTEVDFQSYPSLEAVSCATPALCGALDITGDALTTTSPGTTAWGSVKISSTLQADLYGIGCGGGSHGAACVGVESSGKVAVSTNPGSSPATWHLASPHGAKALVGAACGSASLCVVGGAGGRLFVTRNPGSASAWKPVTIAGARSEGFNKIACHGTSLCLAVSSFSRAVIATHPSASASAWHAQGRIDGGSVTAVSCPSSTACFVGDSIYDIVEGRG
jgi:hypothetical protein